MRTIAFALLLTLLWAVTPAAAEGSPPRVDKNLGKPAPALDIDEWINGDPVTLKDLRGKVVVVDFFQLWCPGCIGFSIPLLKYWEDLYADELKSGDLVVLSIHTVFEGHEHQSPERLRKFLKKKKIHHLVGIDRHGPNSHVPETMQRYGTRGTPEMAIIDRSGKIRFQRFGGFNQEEAEHLIDALLKETPPPA